VGIRRDEDEEHMDDLVTVCYSQRTGEVVGSLIKGASKLAEIAEKTAVDVPAELCGAA
jgi:hypothetical protein